MIRRLPHAAAFALALVMTLGIFSSVTSLSAPEHAGAVLAQLKASATART